LSWNTCDMDRVRYSGEGVSATTSQNLDPGASVGNAPAQLHATMELVKILPHGDVSLKSEHICA
jgi:hypothetical protein